MTSLAEILHKPENIELIKGIAEEIKAEHKAIPYLPRGEVVPFDEWRKKLIEIAEFVNPLVSSNIGLPEIELDRHKGYSRYNNEKKPFTLLRMTSMNMILSALQRMKMRIICN